LLERLGGDARLGPSAPRVPTIETERLWLRPFAPDDLDDLIAYATREAFWRYLPIDPQTPASVAEFLRARLAEQAAEPDDRITLAIEPKRLGRHVGSVRLAIRDPANRIRGRPGLLVGSSRRSPRRPPTGPEIAFGYRA